MKYGLPALLLLVFACDAPAPSAGEPVPSRPNTIGEPQVTWQANKHELGGGDRPVGPNYSPSPIYAQHAMVATAHPLASQIALDILRAGGTAVDAAIAANAALGLMEPIGNGIGGDLFAIVWDPKTATLHGYNGSG